MTQKGKFQILSYYIENNLIFYKSINNHKKLIAFTLFRIKSISTILPKILHLLTNELISYFSIQINTDEEKFLLICIENENRANIKKLFLIIKDKIKSEDQFEILTKHELEINFLKIFNKNIENNSRLRKYDDSILLNYRDKQIKISFYNLCLNLIEKKISFINNLIRVLNNFNQESNLIFNFKTNNSNEILLNSYLIIFMKKETSKSLLSKDLNSFFEATILKKQVISIEDIGYILWRLPISNLYFNYENFTELFEFKSQSISLIFTNYLEEKLVEKNIPFLKLNQNMMIINRKVLFIINARIEIDYIKKIIDEYYSKYFIYLVIIYEKQYQKLLNIKDISLLNCLTILNGSEFYDFNFELLENDVRLENS